MSLLRRLLGPKVDKLRERRDVAGLRAVLESGASPELKREAVEALVWLDDLPARSAIVEALASGEATVSGAAEAALRKLGPEAGGLLAEALGGAAGERALAVLLDSGEAALEALRAAAGATAEPTRLLALEGLLALDRRLQGRGAVREVAFRSLLASLGDRSPACRRRAASGLASLADRRAARALAAQLKDGDEAVREACRQALAELGESTVPHLVDALRDRNPNSRRLAAGLLGEACSAAAAVEVRREAVAALVEHVDDRNPETREAVGRALGRIPADDVLAAQLELLAESERSDRDEVLELIRGLLDRAAISPGPRAAAVAKIRDSGDLDEADDPSGQLG